MSYQNNRAVVLKRRPQGEIRDGDLAVVERPLDEPGEGEILIQTLWLSLDPYMRPRMNDMKSYAEPIAIDEVIVGESVGRVIESRSDAFEHGDLVTSYSGWQEYSVSKADAPGLRKIENPDIPLSVYLGVAGMPGRTGYCGLMYVGKPSAGETVVVAAASGPVGSVVGQTAKEIGCRAVGIAGGPEKCRFVTEELGFDACLDYKAGDLPGQLRDACPDGIDVYFENVGGDVAKAVAPLLNQGARVPICGYVSAYNAESMEGVDTPFDIFGKLPDPPEHRFFLVTEWDDKHAEITRLLAEKVKSGELKYRESVAEGLDNAVDAFRKMLRGDKLGKQLVKIAE